MAKDLDALILEGSKKYALRDFEAATEIFAKACERYSETHETDSPALLFLYGRSLFQVGVSKSDVLGSSNENKEDKDDEEADEEDEAKEKKPEVAKSTDKEPKSKFQFAEDEIVKDYEQEDKEETEKQQQTGDEAEAEEEQSDLEAAWEILDTSRALFLTEIEKQNKLLKESDSQAIKDKIEELEKGLAETYDVLGEVSLESENFEQAVLDLQESLKLKKKLYAPTSSLISEAHFKLSLAYEYCVDDPEHPASKPHESSTTETAVKNKQRAVEEMEAAIAIVTAREKAGDNKDATLLHDLELRLNDLKNSIKNGEETDKQKEDVIKGLAGTSASSSAQDVAATLVKQSIAQAISGATDLSGLVRKGKKKKDTAGNKRKLEEDEQGSDKKKVSR